MAEKTGIGWCNSTWNPWLACDKVSAECKNCYIHITLNRAGIEPFGGPVRAKSTWKYPRKWNKKAAETGEPWRVFTCSLSDFFHPGADEWRDEAWDLIRECTNLTWLILTKRPEHMLDRMPKDWGDGWDHVWLGATVGIDTSLPRIPLLKEVPAKVRFVSAEPLLGPIDFTPHIDGIDWIITGCEQAGPEKRRRMELDWVRDIDKQCRDANIAHYFKQYYNVAPSGREYGGVVTDGVLDGEIRHDWPN